MVRKITVLALVILAVFTFAETYAIYHLSTPLYKTKVLISIMGEGRAHFTVYAFDCNGKKLWQNTYDSEEYSTLTIDLSKFIKGHDDNWGLLLIDSSSLLHLTVLYEDVEYGLLCRDHIVEPVWFFEDTKYYWYAAGYINKGNSETGLVLINPNNEEANGSFWISDSKGRTVENLSGTIKPYAAVFFDLTKYIKDDVGFVDIQTDLPIIIAVEHYEKGGLWIVDNVVSCYTTTEW